MPHAMVSVGRAPVIACLQTASFILSRLFFILFFFFFFFKDMLPHVEQ